MVEAITGRKACTTALITEGGRDLHPPSQTPWSGKSAWPLEHESNMNSSSGESVGAKARKRGEQSERKREKYCESEREGVWELMAGK